MRLIMGGINGHYLRNITENASRDSEEVLAAVAYATNAELLFEWCWESRIPLRFYGRLDDQVAVTIPVLESFLHRKSGAFVCRLVQHHHAKVIWWRGFGVYIGSANLTNSAWYSNIEAGCFFLDDEVSDEMAAELDDLFARLEQHSTPLTKELVDEMRWRASEIQKETPDARDFWRHSSLVTWSGLAQTSSTSAGQRRSKAFLEEWYSTLQHLRDIGELVSRPDNRPTWVNDAAPTGAQADQFLHAYYYQRTFDGAKANYPTHHEKKQGASRCGAVRGGRLVARFVRAARGRRQNVEHPRTRTGGSPC